MKIIFLALLIVACNGVAMATPGGVDAQGCHGSKKIGHHCHPNRAGTGQGMATSLESPAQRDKRLKRECKGHANSGLCEGYTR
jgi:hypothetical protein